MTTPPVDRSSHSQKMPRSQEFRHCKQCNIAVISVFAQLHYLYETHKFCSAACLDRYVRKMSSGQVKHVRFNLSDTP